jgi:hypothetical protein
MEWNSRRTGFILGMLAPLAGFLIYGSIYTNAIRPMYDMAWFVKDLFLGTMEYRTRIVSLSLVADAFLFFALDRRDMHKSMRGVIQAMLVYGVLIVLHMLVELIMKHGMS